MRGSGIFAWRRMREAARQFATAPVRGSAGGTIAPHRTLLTIPLSWSDAVGAGALTTIFTLTAYVAAPAVFSLWARMLSAGAIALRLEDVQRAHSTLLFLQLPLLSVSARPPGVVALGLGAAVAVVLLVAAHWLATRSLPTAYLFRAIAIVLASAVVTFAFGRKTPSLDLATYTRTTLQVSAAIWLFVPVLYGLTLFLLDISWPRKVLVIALALLHLAVFIPLQQLLGIFVVQHLTLLVLPVLFVFASVVPQVAILVAFYAWAASWPERRR